MTDKEKILNEILESVKKMSIEEYVTLYESIADEEDVKIVITES